MARDSWQDGGWRRAGNTNVWAPMSCDEELGHVYLPAGTPTNDYYGGDRPGANLFAEGLVALDAQTGERVWHFQTVHHGLWDYDLPAAPPDVVIVEQKAPIRHLLPSQVCADTIHPAVSGQPGRQ